MFCPSCSNELPDEANFCWKCGRQLKVVDVVSTPKWEYCEIGCEGSGLGVRFWAKAIGARGVYTVATSDTVRPQLLPFILFGDIPDEGDESHRTVLNCLIKQLAADGWEAIPEKGNCWYSYKFRRLRLGSDKNVITPDGPPVIGY